MNLGNLFSRFQLEKVRLNLKAVQLEVSFQEADKDAAWELYVEMLTRIVTQPLPDESGDEQTALDSMYSLFPTTREILRRRGRHDDFVQQGRHPSAEPSGTTLHCQMAPGEYRGRISTGRQARGVPQGAGKPAGGPAQLQPYAGGNRRCGGPDRLGRACRRVSLGTRHNVFISYYHDRTSDTKTALFG